MSSPTADPQEVSGRRVSRIPSRPASRRGNNERATTAFSVSATGSPIAATAPLPSRRNVPVMTTASRIPTAFRTPTSTHTYSGSRPRSFVGRFSAQSSLPRAPSSHTPPAIEARPSSAPHAHVASLSRNKPLPNPPVAQVINPNSPPKAQRTLVDAEAGILSANVWPILAPVDATLSSATLTIDDTTQQLQSRHVSNHPNPEEVADTYAVHRTQDALPNGIEPSGAATNAYEVLEQHESETVQRRHFSSNNPYSRDFHAVTPSADIALSSPLTNTANSPTLLSIPPRVSSKRISLPLIGHLLAPSPIRATSSSSSPGQSTATEWPLTGVDTATTPPARTSVVQVEQDANSETSTPGLESCSTPSLTNGYVTAQGSFYNPATGSSMRRIGGRPGRGPVLRVHGDAQAVLFGNPDNFPEDSVAPNPRRTSFAANTGLLSRQVSSRIGTTASSPVLISPIRTMKPARRPSASPLANTFTPQPPPEDNVLVEFKAVANTEVGNHTASRGASVPASRPLATSNSIQSDVEAPKQTSSFRLRAQRSLRSLFGRKENKPAENRPASIETKRSSLTSGARSLVKRISRNFSKEDLPVIPAVPEAELQSLEELTREQPVMRPTQTPTPVPARAPAPVPAPVIEPVSAPASVPVPASSNPAAIHPETARIITEMADRAEQLSPEACDTALALEIGDAVIEISERASKAIIGKEQAEEHIEEAQKQMEYMIQANIGLNELMQLNFDDPVLQGLKNQLQGSPFLADIAAVGGGGAPSSEHV